MSNLTSGESSLGQQPVGQLLADEIDARGWSQVDFAAVLGRPAQFVSEIISGRKEITRESAAQIGAALSQSPQFWLNLQDEFLLAEQAKNSTAQAKLTDVRRRARLNSLVPVQLLQKRGVLQSVDLDGLEAEVASLLELDSLDDEPVLDAAAKRTNHDEEITVLQRAWVFCVRRKAREQSVRHGYSRKRLAALAMSLPRTVRTESDFAQLPKRLEAVGVRLVFVESLPGAKIDGCAMLLGDQPVIGLSGRGKRLDKVLFALLHEIAHILRGHVDQHRVIVEDLDDKRLQETEQETEANTDGSAWIFPNGSPSVPGRVNGPWIEATADELGIAPIVLIGQLQKRGRLDWRTTLAKDAPSVAEVLPSWG